MKAMDVKIAVLNVMSLSMVTSHKWIAFWGCFLNIFVKGMILYEKGHLEWFFFFRGAPSGYFGESSAGTFNPSWYLNDLGTMYKRVGLLILTFCSVQICWNTPLYACRFNFQDPAHFSREPSMFLLMPPILSKLTFSGTLLHPCLQHWEMCWQRIALSLSGWTGENFYVATWILECHK